jgi:hypothetical protein
MEEAEGIVAGMPAGLATSFLRKRVLGAGHRPDIVPHLNHHDPGQRGDG